MSLILLIETYNSHCNVGIAQNGNLIHKESDNQGNSHSAILTTLIEKSLKQTNLQLNLLDAIAVSKGPGSYTGLRIGVSTSKGLCYGADKPLIALDTLKYLALAVSSNSVKDTNAWFCPMIDARRLEVYRAVYNSENEEIHPPEAVIINQTTFNNITDNKRLFYFGDGAEKCRNILDGIPNLEYVDIAEYQVMDAMASKAAQKFEQKLFENTAYFEPFYLKDFIAVAPKVKGLH